METFVESQPVVRNYFTRRRRVPYVRLTCTLAAAGVLASSAILINPMHARYYETAAGEHRTIQCSSGSITLNTRSRIAIQCTRNLLRVSLLSGEASFRTAQDPSMSVLVLAGDTRVDDFGSAFSVRRGADRTTVTVSEGLVELSVIDSAQQSRQTVSEMPVRAGESATVTNRGPRLMLGSHRIGHSPAATGITG